MIAAAGNANLLIGVSETTRREIGAPGIRLTHQARRTTGTAVFWTRQEISA